MCVWLCSVCVCARVGGCKHLCVCVRVCSPVGLVQLHHLLLHLLALGRAKGEVADVVQGAGLVAVMVTELGLQRIGPQEGVGDEGAGEAA